MAADQLDGRIKIESAATQAKLLVRVGRLDMRPPLRRLADRTEFDRRLARRTRECASSRRRKRRRRRLRNAGRNRLRLLAQRLAFSRVRRVVAGAPSPGGGRHEGERLRTQAARLARRQLLKRLRAQGRPGRIRIGRRIGGLRRSPRNSGQQARAREQRMPCAPAKLQACARRNDGQASVRPRANAPERGARDVVNGR